VVTPQGPWPVVLADNRVRGWAQLVPVLGAPSGVVLLGGSLPRRDDDYGPSAGALGDEDPS
jgi:hypothetical protein